MTTVTVYRFRMYEIAADQMITSRRMGTREGIDKIGGEVIEDSGAKIDDSRLSGEIEGLTIVGFVP